MKLILIIIAIFLFGCSSSEVKYERPVGFSIPFMSPGKAILDEINNSLEVKTKWVCEVVIDRVRTNGADSYYVTRIVNAKDSIQADSIFQVYIHNDYKLRNGVQAMYQIASLKNKTINP